MISRRNWISLKKSGAWYSYKGDRLGQGRENSKQYLKENPETTSEIERLIREHHSLDGQPKAADEKDESFEEVPLDLK